MCLLKQNLWDNFVFGEVNFDKLDNHIQELANDIIKKNNLSPITMLSDLRFGNDNVGINYFLFNNMYINLLLSYEDVVKVKYKTENILIYFRVKYLHIIQLI